MYSDSIPQYDLFDTVQFVKEQSEKGYVDCLQDIIGKAPFGNRHFYIFSFMKRVDDTQGIKRMIHQPRLTKPEPVPGSTLIRVHPRNPEEAKIMWTLPNEEAFGLYKQGKIFGNEFVHECVQRYLKNPMEMCRPEPGDMLEEEIYDYYKQKAKRP